MHLTFDQSADLARLFSLLHEEDEERTIRLKVGELLLRLTGSDYFASFVWDEASRRFARRLQIGMDEANLDRYDRHFQYRDPITPALKQRAAPTLVSAIMPRADFVRTEFFTDFLARDGLAYGVNMYCVDGERHVGDLRLWRASRRGDFDTDTVDLLALIRPALSRALAKARDRAGSPGVPSIRLSARQQAIAKLVAAGASDKEIGRLLGIAPTTVRSHVDQLKERLGVARRSAIGAALAEAGLAESGAAAAPRS